ncbi:MAG: hypothetical protein H6807_16415 [Planctomycetes bacterium]|nr:hypothetical protein [Planctomycetota bacterium]
MSDVDDDPAAAGGSAPSCPREETGSPAPQAACYWAFTVVPVQEWIEAARRSRDLRAGSVFLSWIMERALAALRDRAQALGKRLEILLPKLDDLPTHGFDTAFAGSYSMPNRAAGRIVGCSLDQAEEALRQAESAVESSWTELRSSVVNGLAADVRARLRMVKKALTSAQSPVSSLWCLQLAEVEATEGLAAVDTLMGALKRDRPRLAFPPGQPWTKCSLCGLREAIGPEVDADQSPGKRWNVWRAVAHALDSDRKLLDSLRIEAGDRLCPTCLVKRRAGYLSGGRFPSTGAIAAADWLQEARSLSPGACGRLEKAAEAIDRTDPELLFYTRGRPTPSTSSPPRPSDAALDRELRSAAVALAADLERSGLTGEPSTVLAVLTFDGDSLGERSREHLAAIPNGKDVAERLQVVIRGCLGRSFYLGGDEGLILCPASTALALARAIRESWRESWGAVTTVSAGIALVDHQQPLSIGLAEARHAIAEAKAFRRRRSRSKDALSVRLKTASGASFGITDGWDGCWPLVEALRRQLVAGRLSSGWVYGAEKAAATILEQLPNDSNRALELIRATWIRKLRRQCDEAVVEGLADDIDGLWTTGCPDMLATAIAFPRLAAFMARHAVDRRIPATTAAHETKGESA